MYKVVIITEPKCVCDVVTEVILKSYYSKLFIKILNCLCLARHKIFFCDFVDFFRILSKCTVEAICLLFFFSGVPGLEFIIPLYVSISSVDVVRSD